MDGIDFLGSMVLADATVINLLVSRLSNQKTNVIILSSEEQNEKC